MPLSIALVSAALLLAVPFGFVVFLLSFRAIGPWRTRPRRVRLPDLADERQGWDHQAEVSTHPSTVTVHREARVPISRFRPVPASRPGRALAVDLIASSADARPAA